MKRNELIELRSRVNQEVERRKRIKELLTEPSVKEYLKKIQKDPVLLDENDLIGILGQILDTFKITKTNGLYVCTSAYYIDCHISYQDTEYYSQDVPINSEYAEFKNYTDIESGEVIRAAKEEKDSYGRPLITNFESNNMILNPYNSGRNANGYREVKMDFFQSALKDGQAKAKRLILSKYPRI